MTRHEADKPRYTFMRIDAAAVAAGLAITAGLYLWGLAPVLERERARIEHERQITDNANELDRLNESLRDVTARLVQTQQAVEASDIRLRSIDWFNGRVAELTTLADAQGLRVETVQPAGTIHGDRYETVPIDLSGRGGYVDCTRFLHQLHESYPDTAVHALLLEGDARRPDEPARFRFTLHWHATPSLSQALP